MGKVTRKCSRCNGTGKISSNVISDLLTGFSTCPDCHGTGFVEVWEWEKIQVGNKDMQKKESETLLAKGREYVSGGNTDYGER